MPKKTWILTDVDADIYVEQISLGPSQVGGSAKDYSVTKRTLRGGRREGVDVIEVHNGRLRFVAIPTRGMGIWRASCGDVQLAKDGQAQRVLSAGTKGGEVNHPRQVPTAVIPVNAPQHELVRPNRILTVAHGYQASHVFCVIVWGSENRADRPPSANAGWAVPGAKASTRLGPVT